MKNKVGSGYANRHAEARAPERCAGTFTDYNAHLKWYYYSTYHPIGFLDPELTLRDYKDGLSIPDAIVRYSKPLADSYPEVD